MIHHVNIVGLIQEMQSMCNENAHSINKWTFEKAVVEDIFSDKGIHSREWIV